MEDLELIDCWRAKNPFQTEYSYYSPPHKGYSRIDYFLVNNSIISQNNNSEIRPIMISAHGLISFNLIQEIIPTPQVGGDSTPHF